MCGTGWKGGKWLRMAESIALGLDVEVLRRPDGRLRMTTISFGRAAKEQCEAIDYGAGVGVGWGQDLKRLVAFTEPRPVAKS